MFCTRLRRRPSFASALPSLISADDLKLKENRLESHDVAIPLNEPPNTAYARQLRILLMSPSSVSEPKLAETLDQTHRFAALTGGQDLAIVFLLNPPKTTIFTSAKTLATLDNETESNTNGVLAYAKLQAALLPRRDIPHIPILPLATVEGLPGLLKKHAAALSRKVQTTRSTASSAFELLQLCTTEPPMDRQTAYFATDCFANVRELAVACTEPLGEPTSSSPAPGEAMLESGFVGQYGYSQNSDQDSGARGRLRQLRGLVGEDRYQEMLDFWANEWVVE